MGFKVTVKAAFVYELAKIYDAECKVCAVLPKVTPKLHSPVVKRVLRTYMDGSRLSVGKIEILFHLVRHSVTSVDHNLVDDLVDKCRNLPSDFAYQIHDVVISSVIRQILHLKVASCETLIYFAERLHNETALNLIKEIRDHEIQMLQELSKILHIKSNGTVKKGYARV